MSKTGVVFSETGCLLGTVRGLVAFASVILFRQHQHLFADDLGGVTVFTIPVLPFPGLELPLDVHCLSLCQVFSGNFRQPSPEGDIVPLGPLFPFSSLVLEAFRCRK